MQSRSIPKYESLYIACPVPYCLDPLRVLLNDLAANHSQGRVFSLTDGIINLDDIYTAVCLAIAFTDSPCAF